MEKIQSTSEKIRRLPRTVTALFLAAMLALSVSACKSNKLLNSANTTKTITEFEPFQGDLSQWYSTRIVNDAHQVEGYDRAKPASIEDLIAAPGMAQITFEDKENNRTIDIYSTHYAGQGAEQMTSEQKAYLYFCERSDNNGKPNQSIRVAPNYVGPNPDAMNRIAENIALGANPIEAFEQLYGGKILSEEVIDLIDSLQLDLNIYLSNGEDDSFYTDDVFMSKTTATGDPMTAFFLRVDETLQSVLLSRNDGRDHCDDLRDILKNNQLSAFRAHEGAPFETFHIGAEGQQAIMRFFEWR